MRLGRSLALRTLCISFVSGGLVVIYRIFTTAIVRAMGIFVFALPRTRG